MENVTKALPEIVDYVRNALPDVDYIVEGEVIATKDGNPISFQYILQRVKRKYDVEKMIEKIPLKIFLFDILYYKEPTAELPMDKRRELLNSVVNVSPNVELSTMKTVNSDNVKDAEELFKWSIDEGHEGIMFKDVASPYSPGKRGKNMLKYKPLRETLDCVITGGLMERVKEQNSSVLTCYHYLMKVLVNTKPWFMQQRVWMMNYLLA